MKSIKYFMLIVVFFSLRVLSQETDVTNQLAIETLRFELNSKSPDTLSSPRNGDIYVFETGKAFVKGSNPIERELQFIKNWGEPQNSNPQNSFFNDVKYLYKYFAALNASKLKNLKQLPVEYAKYLIPQPKPYSVGAFIKKAKERDADTLFYDDKISLGESVTINEGVEKIIVLNGSKPIGFLIKGKKLNMDFIYRGKHLVKNDTLNNVYKNIVADFPLPMHTGSSKLLELGIEKGEVINYIMGGGGRRSGVVVIDKNGNAFPVHIQNIKLDLINEKESRILDLSNSVEDLEYFIEFAKKEKLSLAMEMMLLDYLGDTQNAYPINDVNVHNDATRRMVVWETDDSKNPAYLALDAGCTANHMTYTALQLGYKWGIYCDVNYYDNCSYWINGKERVNFSWEKYSTQKQTSYHRMILYLP